MSEENANDERPKSETAWLDKLRELAIEFCQSIALIEGPPDVRPWNDDQVLWAGLNGPAPDDEVFAYHAIGEPDDRVVILGQASRRCLSRFLETFCRHRDGYGAGFVRDMLVGLLELSLPGADIGQFSSPYWKRYVTPAVAEAKAGSPERYGDAVLTAVGALPAPHPPTVVVLPLAGIATLQVHSLAGVSLLPAESCSSDPEISGCGMFLKRLKDLQQRASDDPLVFAKVAVDAEPGLAVERAVQRTEQLCRLLRVIPNPGLADAPLTDPPRIDLDAADSEAFYISRKSIGTHPIPVRRVTSDFQGKLGNWRVAPSLSDPCWSRMASLIECGARCDVEARLLAGLRFLGDAVAEPLPAPAIVAAATAVEAMIGIPDGAMPEDNAAQPPRQLLANIAVSLCGEGSAGLFEHVWQLRHQLLHDLDRPVAPADRADAVWLAFNLLMALAKRDQLRGFSDLLALP